MQSNDFDLEGAEDGEVQVFVYDMTKGLASSLSQMVLGKHIEGIWHTGIVAYGREYFFGGGGIESCQPGGTVLGQPDRIFRLGATEVPYSLFLEYIFGLGESTFKPGTYDLFKHNCNNFSNEVSIFLTGKGIPEFIMNLPQDVLSSPLGESLRPVLESLSLKAEGSRGVSFGAQAEEEAGRRQQEDGAGQRIIREDSPDWVLPARQNPVRTPADGRTGNSQTPSSPTPDTTSNGLRLQPEGVEMDGNQGVAGETGDESTSGERPSATGQEDDDNGEDEEVKIPKRERKQRPPPLVFREVDASQAFEAFLGSLKEGVINQDERQLVVELSDFVLADTGAWALGAQHLQLIGQLLQGDGLPQEGKIGLVKFLQAAALKDDIILLLHMDRKDHILMNYINDFEKLQPDLQEEIAKLICNLCLPDTASDWLLYISEWQNAGQPCSNGRVTVRVAVNSLLSDKPHMQEIGVRLMYNLGHKEVFDDTATELASAILQHLHNDLSEEHAFHLLTSLLNFMNVSYHDVPALVKMLGPDINKFKGKSERVDNLVEQINSKLAASINV